MNSVKIRAESFDKALMMGSRKLGVPKEAVSGTIESEISSGVVVLVYVTADTGAEQAQDLFSRLEKEVDRIDSLAFEHHLTEEDLEERGLLGTTVTMVNRSAFSSATAGTPYVFEDNVDVLPVTRYEDPAAVPDFDLAGVTDIAAGTQIAHAKAEATDVWPPKDAPPRYIETSNIKIKTEGSVLKLFAGVNGVVVLIRKFPYVIPNDRDGNCTVSIDPDKMTARATITPNKGAGKPVELADVIATLNKAGVNFGINADGIRRACEFVKMTSEPNEKVVVATGELPVPGGDAAITYYFNSDPEADNFTIMPDGRIDYHKRAHAQMAEKGQKLAAIGAPTPGFDGHDVTGKVLPLKPGDTKVLYPGENVILDPRGNCLYAETDGLIQLNNNILNVLQHFNVPGNVDYRCGNIHFNGNVTVNGNVMPGFEVVATGDIVILGDVDNAYLKSGRDLTVANGIIGSSGKPVECGRNLMVGFLQNAIIEAEGNVTVRNFCMHSHVNCTGRILLKEMKGAIIGGDVNALNGIEAKTAGSVTGTKTSMTIGLDFLVINKIEEHRRAKEFLAQSIEKINTVLNPITDLVKKGQRLEPEQKLRLTAIMQKRKDISKNMMFIEARMRRLNLLSLTPDDPAIVITGELFGDVLITIKDQVLLTKVPTKRVKLSIDTKAGHIVSGSY